MDRNVILSLFDHSGNWSRPYLENGYEVIRVDIENSMEVNGIPQIDILEWDYTQVRKDSVYGILAAVPCTDYALSGARHFAEKDADGRTAASNRLVERTKDIIEYFDPVFWCVENPMSRVHKLHPWLGDPAQKLNPYEVAGYDPEPRNSQYQKTTWLWGRFNPIELKPLENIDGQKLWRNLGGKSRRTKQLRSATPLGLAYGFYEANRQEACCDVQLQWRMSV